MRQMQSAQLSTSSTATQFRRPLPGSRGWTGDTVVIGNLAGTRSQRRGAAPSSKYLLAPTDADPATFEWPAKGRSLVVLDRDPAGSQEFRLALIRALLADGAESLVMLVSSAEPNGFPAISYHRKPGAM